jgi:hypothetical protein
LATYLRQAIAGPAGAMIGQAIASALGTTATPEKVKDALTRAPDPAGELQHLEDSTAQLLQGQIDLNKMQAASGSLFVAGARPAAMWACILCIVYVPFEMLATWLSVNVGLRPPPAIELDTFLTVLGFLAAMCGIRGLETIKGVARGRLK